MDRASCVRDWKYIIHDSIWVQSVLVIDATMVTIMSMHGLMFDKSQPTAKEIEDQIDDAQDIGLYSMLFILPPVLAANLYAT
ncbi:hypothetical protein MRB53_007119 [Persea americana]|uniref:Uncharacterized protein n=1 Tax=Persea americana TaxID=3435 RepID=A0ACC2MHX7_PERAE|nr:hypothetical protein MRB53_007119 [Persea americana]